jgi:hypothetical protein
MGPTLLAGLITQDGERRGDHQGLELRAPKRHLSGDVSTGHGRHRTTGRSESNGACRGPGVFMARGRRRSAPATRPAHRLRPPVPASWRSCQLALTRAPCRAVAMLAGGHRKSPGRVLDQSWQPGCRDSMRSSPRASRHRTTTSRIHSTCRRGGHNKRPRRRTDATVPGG